MDERAKCERCKKAAALIRTMGTWTGLTPASVRSRILMLWERVDAHEADGKSLTIAAADLPVIRDALQLFDAAAILHKHLELIDDPSD